MLTEINGKIRVVSEGDKVVLVIAKNDFEKFKEYECSIDSNKFHADFLLDNKQSWISGVFKKKENQKDNTVIMTIFLANKQGNGEACTTAAEIKTLFGLDNTKKEVEVQMLQHPRKQVKELKSKITELQEQLSNRPDAAQLKDKEDKIKELEAKINQPNAEVESLKKDLQARNARVHQLEKENKELEAKNKTTEHAALYTATAGMGLAVGLIAFTALERTVRLEMLVMIGIAVTSALVVGGITYAVLPSTQVDEAKSTRSNENGKSK